MYVVCVCMYVVICKIDHCIHIHWCIVMGLGHNDPWVESHMWPQQTWGQRSSRGQWPLVQVFGKKGQCIHILWCIFKSIKYYNDCKSMWSRKQARLVVREPPCYHLLLCSICWSFGFVNFVAASTCPWCAVISITCSALFSCLCFGFLQYSVAFWYYSLLTSCFCIYQYSAGRFLFPTSSWFTLPFSF